MLDRDEYAQSAYESERYTALRIARDEGREEGRVEGREEGRQEGREEGRVEGREEGREEGRVEGCEEGARKERLASAAHMKADGMDLALIAKYTGLTLQELSSL